MRYEDARLTRFTAPTSLPHNNVLALYEDSEDNVWVGTQGGLLRLSPSAGTTITTADGAPLSINTVYQDADGTLLVAAWTASCCASRTGSSSPCRSPIWRGAQDPQRLSGQRRSTVAGHRRQGAVRIDGGRVTRLTNRQGW